MAVQFECNINSCMYTVRAAVYFEGLILVVNTSTLQHNIGGISMHALLMLSSEHADMQHRS